VVGEIRRNENEDETLLRSFAYGTLRTPTTQSATVYLDCRVIEALIKPADEFDINTIH